MTRPLTTLAVHNLKVGRGQEAIDGLQELIRDADPDAILLQEAKFYLPRLRKAFAQGWRIHAGRAFTEAANCPVMVRRDVEHGRGAPEWGVVRNRATWAYRGKGRFVVHRGRAWVWAVVDGVAVLSVHRATEALGFNEKAGAEEALRLGRWLRGRPVAFVAGDWNNLSTDKRDHSPAHIARLADATLVVPDGARIDYALVKGLDLVAEHGKRYGSDHHAHVYRRT